jgi:hypothetical protein
MKENSNYKVREICIATLAASRLVDGVLVGVSRLPNQSVYELTMATSLGVRPAFRANSKRTGGTTRLKPYPEIRKVSETKIEVDLGNNCVIVQNGADGKLFDIVFNTAEADTGLNVEFIFTGRGKEWITDTQALKTCKMVAVRAGTGSAFRLVEVAVGAIDGSGNMHGLITKVYATGSSILSTDPFADIVVYPKHDRIYPLEYA